MSEELHSRGVATDIMRNSIALAEINGGNVIAKGDLDFCLFLDKDKYMSQMLEKSGVRLFNSARAIELCDDKMQTHITLANNGIPMPQTLGGLLCYFDDSKTDKNELDYVQNKLGFPLIVKLAYGSMGKSVFKADNRKQLDELAERVKMQPHLFQKYIDKSHGKDMRVIVIGGRTVGAILRMSNGDFRSNIGLGGTAKKVDVPKEISDLAEKAANILGLDYCGIDFLLGDTPLLCEVNSNAFFDAFENVTGINVAAIYAEHIIDKMTRT